MSRVIALATALFATSALACGCDEECPPGEVYSDEAEMCVSQTDAVS